MQRNGSFIPLAPGALPGVFQCWVLAALLCAADAASLLGAAAMGLISLACGVKGWLTSLADLQDSSGCGTGTAPAGPVELEDGWQPGSLSPPAPSPVGAGSASHSAALVRLWGRIALQARVLAALSSGGKHSLLDLLCRIAAEE